MKNTPLRNGVQAVSIFGVVIIFLVLIGFSVTGSALIGKIIGRVAADQDSLPPIENFYIFMALLGLFTGLSAAKASPDGKDRWNHTLLSGLFGGLFTGLVVAVFALVLGVIYLGGTDLRNYLAALSPVSVNYFLFGQSPALAAVTHIVLLTLSSVLGAVIAHLWRTPGRKAAWTRFTGLFQSPAALAIRRNRWAVYAVYALLAVGMVLFPRVWGSYWNYITGTVGIYILMGLGLNIIVGLSGQLVLGYVAFFAIGAYSMALLTAPEPHHIQWNFWPALGVAILIAAASGILIGLPLMRLRGDYLAIVTLGFGEIIRIMIRSDALTPITAGPRGIRDIAGPSLFGIPLDNDVNFTYLIIIAVALLIFLTWRIERSRVGRSWVAIREDEIVARASGINTTYYKLLALALGAAFAGLAGSLFASRNLFTGPEDHVLMVSINVLSLVIVGGMGSIPGVILGSFVLKGLPEILREIENYRMLAFGALLVVMMILRPEGLWPAGRQNLDNSAHADGSGDSASPKQGGSHGS